MSDTPRRRVLWPIVLFLALTACERPQAPPEAEPPPEVTVRTLAAESVTLTRELPGRTQPFLIAEVRPQVNGIVADRLFTEGGEVQAGDGLYQLDDATYRAAVNSAAAQLRRAEATLESARLSATRVAELVRIDAVSVQEHESAVAALAQAEADVGAARAALDAAEVTLGYARITAPIGGHIGRSSVTRGALVNANQAAPLATVQQLDPMYVDLAQSSSELLQLRRQLSAGRLESTDTLPVTILLEDGTRYPHEGTLAFAEVTVDPSTGSFALRVVVDNPDQVLLPGMYVRAVIGSGVRPAAILVPQPAVARDPRGDTSVMLVAADGTVEMRPIEVSQAIGGRWLVESGLEPGDRVVIEGLQKIRAGDTVTAVELDEPAAPDAPAAQR